MAAIMNAAEPLPLPQLSNLTGADKDVLIKYCDEHKIQYLTKDDKVPQKAWMQAKVYNHLAGLTQGDLKTDEWLAARFKATNDVIKQELYGLRPRPVHDQIAVMSRHELFLALCRCAPRPANPQSGDNGDVIMKDGSSRSSSMSEGKGPAMDEDSDGGEGSRGQEGQEDQQVKTWLMKLQPEDSELVTDLLKVILTSKLVQQWVKAQNTSSSVQDPQLVQEKAEASERVASLEQEWAMSRATVDNLTTENNELTKEVNDLRFQIKEGDRQLGDVKRTLSNLLTLHRQDEAKEKAKWDEIDRYLQKINGKSVY